MASYDDIANAELFRNAGHGVRMRFEAIVMQIGRRALPDKLVVPDRLACMYSYGISVTHALQSNTSEPKPSEHRYLIPPC